MAHEHLIWGEVENKLEEERMEAPMKDVLRLGTFCSACKCSRVENPNFSLADVTGDAFWMIPTPLICGEEG